LAADVVRTMRLVAWLAPVTGMSHRTRLVRQRRARGLADRGRLHLAFFAASGEPLEDEDPSDRLLDVESPLAWLREHGFDDVDCYWKCLETSRPRRREVVVVMPAWSGRSLPPPEAGAVQLASGVPI
jgi:hypothetical protein